MIAFFYCRITLSSRRQNLYSFIHLHKDLGSYGRSNIDTALKGIYAFRYVRLLKYNRRRLTAIEKLIFKLP